MHWIRFTLQKVLLTKIKGKYSQCKKSRYIILLVIERGSLYSEISEIFLPFKKKLLKEAKNWRPYPFGYHQGC